MKALTAKSLDLTDRVIGIIMYLLVAVSHSHLGGTFSIVVQGVPRRSFLFTRVPFGVM